LYRAGDGSILLSSYRLASCFYFCGFPGTRGFNWLRNLYGSLLLDHRCSLDGSRGPFLSWWFRVLLSFSRFVCYFIGLLPIQPRSLIRSAESLKTVTLQNQIAIVLR